MVLKLLPSAQKSCNHLGELTLLILVLNNIKFKDEEQIHEASKWNVALSLQTRFANNS